MNANPFLDEHTIHRQPSFPEEQARLRTYTPYTSPEKPKGLGQSRSEANVAFITPTPIKTQAHNASTVHFEDEEEFPDRGRPKQRGSYRYLDEYKEELSPSRRSRSPMKKMFGENGWLGRSTSMKEMATEHDWKSGFKHWGGKIKQRVEGIVSVSLTSTADTQHRCELFRANTYDRLKI